MARKTQKQASDYVAGVTRISLGSIFLWAFVDKAFGLGFATCRGDDGAVETMCESAWLSGGSPTTGFLKFGTEGSPIEGIFTSMAGNALWDWLFMLGLLGIGVALILGIGMKIAAYSGTLLMALMYLALFQPEHHPLVDDHVIYALVLMWLYKVNDSQALGMGDWWKKQSIVKQYPVLK